MPVEKIVVLAYFWRFLQNFATVKKPLPKI